MIRTFLGLLLVSSAALLAVVDAAVAFGQGWRPGNGVDWGIIVFGLTGTVALYLSALAPSFRAFFRTRSTELILLGGMIALSLAGVELVLRSLPDPAPPQFHHAPANLSVTVSRKKEMPKKMFTTNSQGIRGPELSPDATYRVLCIGGSTTQNHYMDDSKTWTNLLMFELKDRLPDESVWTGSTGIPGFATPQHLTYLRTNPSLNQYTHTVFLIGVNDVLLWLSLKFDRDQSDEQEAPPKPRWEALATYERLAAIFSPSSTLLLDAADAWPLEEVRKIRAESTLIDTYAPPGPALNHYRERINAMIDRCQELGIDPVFVTQPVLWAKNLPPSVEALLWMGKTRVDNEFMSAAALRELMDLFNATLIETCRERDVLVVDLGFMNGSTQYFLDDCHFTEPGAAIVAQTIAEALSGRLKPPQQAATDAPKP